MESWTTEAAKGDDGGKREIRSGDARGKERDTRMCKRRSSEKGRLDVNR